MEETSLLHVPEILPQDLEQPRNTQTCKTFGNPQRFNSMVEELKQKGGTSLQKFKGDLWVGFGGLFHRGDCLHIHAESLHLLQSDMSHLSMSRVCVMPFETHHCR